MSGHPNRAAILGGGLLAILFTWPLAVMGSEELPAAEEPGVAVEELERLRSISYASWGETSEPEVSGVVRHEERAWSGYNLYTNDIDEAYLMDMDGRIAHRWKVSGEYRKCEHVELLEDGEILLVCVGQGLLRLDRDSRILWKVDGKIHHDVRIRDDGTLLAVFSEEVRIYNEHRVKFDGLLDLASDGTILGRWSTFENLAALQRLHPPSPLDEPPADDSEKLGKKMDYYHLNTVEVLPPNHLGEQDHRFQQGNLLLCLRNADLVTILDRESREVVWHWGPGQLDYPHRPTLLPSGRLLLFDNGAHRGWSRVLELDPLSGRIVWEYKTDPPERFFSQWRGSAQRLPNGNTLICDSESGRAFEVTADGTVVWDFWNPEVEDGKRKLIYRLLRVPASRVTPWLPAGPS